MGVHLSNWYPCHKNVFSYQFIKSLLMVTHFSFVVIRFLLSKAEVTWELRSVDNLKQPFVYSYQKSQEKFLAVFPRLLVIFGSF